MAGQRVVGEPAAVLHEHGRFLFEVDGCDLARAMEVAFAIRRAQLQLSIGIEILTGDRNVPRPLDHEQIRLARSLEFESIGRAAGDDDVIVVTKWQRTEHRVQGAASAMDEDRLVGVGVAKQLLLRLIRAAARQGDVVVAENRDAPRDRVARARNRACFHVMVAEGGLIAKVTGDRPRRLEPNHPGRRPQVVDDAVGAGKPGNGDDFLVIDPFALEPRLMRMGNVPLARN
jgi:hypothetical protein